MCKTAQARFNEHHFLYLRYHHLHLYLFLNHTCFFHLTDTASLRAGNIDRFFELAAELHTTLHAEKMIKDRRLVYSYICSYMRFSYSNLIY